MSNAQGLWLIVGGWAVFGALIYAEWRIERGRTR